MATLTYVYSDSTAVVGPMATVREPHSWDLCLGHASRITAPRGWDLMRHAAPLPINPDEDDLVALADAVREGGVMASPPVTGFSSGRFPSDRVSSGGFSSDKSAAHAVAPQRPVTNGRRRGHLRVLPDPGD